MILTIPRGIVWMVSGTVFTTFVAFIINTLATQRLVNVGLFKQIKEFVPILVVSLIMVAVIYIANNYISNMYIQLFGGFVIGVITYSLSAYTFKLKALTDVLKFLK